MATLEQDPTLQDDDVSKVFVMFFVHYSSELLTRWLAASVATVA